MSLPAAAAAAAVAANSAVIKARLRNNKKHGSEYHENIELIIAFPPSADILCDKSLDQMMVDGYVKKCTHSVRNILVKLAFPQLLAGATRCVDKRPPCVQSTWARYPDRRNPSLRGDERADRAGP